MKLFSKNILITIILICFQSFTNEKLIGVFQFIRHGARTPLNYDRDTVELYYPFKSAELTNLGYSMAKSKGDLMREIYSKDGFLASLKSNPEKIHIFTTPYQRTIMTSSSFLKGFLPEFTALYKAINENNLINNQDNNLKKTDKEKEKLKKYNSFLKHSRNEIKESFIEKKIKVEILDKYLYSKKCIQYDSKLFKKINSFNINLNEWNFLNSFKEKLPLLFKDYCEANYKAPCSDIIYKNYVFMEIFDSYIESLYNHNLIDLDDEKLKIIYEAHIKLYYEFYNDYMNIEFGSVLFRYINSFLSNLDNCKPSSHKNGVINIESKLHCKKYVLFSGHDSTIENIIRNLFDYQSEVSELFKESANKKFSELKDKYYFYWSPYISDFTFEVHIDEKNNKKYVRLYMNGKELNDKKFKDISLKYSQNGKEKEEQGVNLEKFISYLDSRTNKHLKYHKVCDEKKFYKNFYID
jgi:hypothetical protein